MARIPTDSSSPAATDQKSVDPDNIIKRYTERLASVGIIGLGYVGLPLAKAFTQVGIRVVGFDVDEEKVRQLNAGQSYIRHISPPTVATMLTTGFRATADFAELADVDAILICVPTPLTRQREPDMSYIVSTTSAIFPHLRPGHLIVLESTTYPGTTTDVMRPILEAGGYKSGVDFFLAYSPEREDPGNPNFETSTIPKVVGGDGIVAQRMAHALYSQVVNKTIVVSSAATAEAVKLTENIFRAVNIALVNELKVVYERMGIDVWEVIDAAKSKPFGFMAFYPGPGLGGHCIPIDPFYLTWKAREFEVATRFIELAGEINTAMPAYVVNQTAQALDRRFSKGLNGAHVLLLGVAYKKNVDDVRESPAFKLMEILEHRGAKVDYFDPFVPEIKITREHPTLAGRRCIPWDLKSFSSYDVALICTDHDGVDYNALADNCKLVVDTRNATKSVANRAAIVQA